MFSVTITGAEQLRREFAMAPQQAAEATKQGLTAAGNLVEGEAKRRVHSNSNPWTGSTDPYYKKPTGKLQTAIATSDVTGSGINQEIRVGVVKVAENFARSVDSGKRTASGRIIAGKSAVNKSDTTVYGPIEERKHPFLGPSLMDNVGRITEIFWQRFQAVVFRRAA